MFSQAMLQRQRNFQKKVIHVQSCCLVSINLNLLLFCRSRCRRCCRCLNSLIIERLRFVFTPNGKREFVPRDQVSPLIVVYSLVLLHRNK